MFPTNLHPVFIFACSLILLGCGPASTPPSDIPSSETEYTSTHAQVQSPSKPGLDEAIARGDIERVKALLKEDPDAVHTGRNPDLPPIAMAILRKKSDIAILLIEAGASVDGMDARGRTLAHLAVERGLSEIIPHLAAAGAPLSTLDGNGWTPLHWAAAKNNLPISYALIECGADIHALTARGGTILHEAAASGSEELALTFLELGVDPSQVASDGGTALEVARAFKNEPVILLLESQQKENTGVKEP